jgi:uroporphyrinogen decarboxylase
MTPKQIATAALTFQPYEGPPPHMELEFQLAPQLVGEEVIRWQMFKDIPKHKRRDELVRNARLWIQIAEKLDWAVITGIHWLPVDAQIETVALIREMVGDKYMLATGLTGTQGIPSSEEMNPLITRMSEDIEGLEEDLGKMCDQAASDIRELTAGGIDIVFLLTDYAFNSGPFFSPRMFRRLVTPFSKRLVETIHEGGAFAVQHTDGNLMLVMDQMLDWGLDGLHSIDPMAGMDIREIRAMASNRLCLFGNVDCSKVQAGTFDEIEESALYCLEHGPLNGTGFFYATSNCIFEGVPLENYMWMLEVRRRWYEQRMKGKT